MPNNFVIEARGVTKIYGQDDARVEALRGVDLTVAAGELVAIIGPSGSGKSSLLSILGAIETPTSGQVLLEGVDLATLSDDQRTLVRRRRIGFIFQAFNLLPTLTALENVALPLELDGVSSEDAHRLALEALALVEVAHRGNHIPNKMSGGEQQRVAIARSLVIKPALLLADEPTGNLDSVRSERVTELLRSLVHERQQATIVVTHDPEVASRADRIVRLRDGLVESNSTNNQPLQATIVATER